MSAQTDIPKPDSTAGTPSKAQNAAPKIDLSAGLIPKKKSVPSFVDLSAGLIAKAENAAQAAGRPASASGRRTAKAHSAANAPDFGDEESSAPVSAAAQASPPQAQKPVNPFRDAVRRSAAVPDETPAERADVSPSEARVLAVDGAPQGTWQSPISNAQAGTASQFTGQNLRSRSEVQNAPPERSQPLRGREPQMPAVPPPPPAAAARREPPPPPEQSWNRVANQRDSVQPEPPATGLSVQHAGETQHNAAARMTGLKNLIESLGLKNQPRPIEPVEAVVQAQVPIEPVQPRTVYARTPPSSAQAPVRKSESSASPTLVTAPPEFLPPKPLVEKSEKEHSNPNNGTSRRDRRETFDDVEILPSWRGQYKRK